MEFGECMKRLRTERKMTQPELAHRVGVTQTAISCWESGSRLPSARYIRLLCEALDVSADSLFDLPPREYRDAGALRPTQKEEEILRIYRTLDEFGRDAVELICRHEKSRVDFGAGTITDFMSANGERYIPKYISVAAAGQAAPNDDAQFEMIRVNRKIPAEADYAVVISGKSMEPYIKDGDTVYVKKTEDLKTGDIGIFSVNGATVCKMLYKTGRGDIHLISANPNEASSNIYIQRDSSDTLVCFGRVLRNKARNIPGYFLNSL